MQEIGKAAEQALQPQSTTSQTQAGPTDYSEAVNQVFAVFKAHWPRKFTSIWPDTKGLSRSKRAWLTAFREHGLTAKDCERGLHRVRGESWPPDNPADFLLHCRVMPEDVGAPPEAKAWKDACHGAYPYNRWHKWSHKCVYHAAVKTGLSDICERGERMRKEFAAEYASACARAHELTEPPTGVLEQKKPQRASKERSLAAIEEMEKIIRGEI